MNRLNDATSPYLLQHAGNPVDWWPWSPEAFAQARERDVPVLLSVGYSACHWCHVMAHESFEDAETARIMNDNLVAIKVDREERPDVDAVYMAATQAMTGQGGWPMTVFMTPAGEPFYCGTYFPRDYFQRLVLGVAQAWREDRGGVHGQAGRIAALLAEHAAPWRGSPPAGSLAAVCDQAVTTLAAGYDSARGGFGQAPKFPPSMVLEFLLRHSERAGRGVDEGGQALAMVTGTCAAMARGGMYDQLAGGFARYSVDAAWVVPHFEKMLYDNALLARVYGHLWRRTGDPLARRVAHETCSWLVRELGTPEGGFAAALDADSDGEEGLFYTWTPAELTAVLGEGDGGYAAQTFGVTPAGTFEHGRSVLQRLADPVDAGRFGQVSAALLAARDQRPRPGRDDKVVAAWNGLAIAALAECGLLLAEPAFTTAAGNAAALLARFADGAGGFYDTADDGEALIYRPGDPTDGPTPSGTFAAADALLSYGALTGSARHREAAAAALAVLAPIASQFPRAAGAGLAVAEAMLAGPAEIAVVGPATDPRTAALHETALLAAPPGAVIAVGEGTEGEPAAPAGDATGWAPAPAGGVPLLAGRDLVAGAPAAYVCRDFACQLPVTGPAELRAALGYPAPPPER